MKIVNSQSHIEQYNFMGEMGDWGHQLWYGINLFEEQVAKIFLTNRKGHHQPCIFKIHFRMRVNHEMISGPFRETSYTAITSNQ